MQEQVRNPVRVVNYDPDWPVVFSRLAEVLQQQLGQLAQAIEHVGSTSVPGLTAKPIIDLDIVIAKETDFPQVCNLLAELGYQHQGNLGIEGREAFKREDKTVPCAGQTIEWMTHNLYVCPADSRELARHLTFRNYLRTHPEVRDAYAELKQRLAKQYTYDRDGYTEAKTEFIVNILQLTITE